MTDEREASLGTPEEEAPARASAGRGRRARSEEPVERFATEREADERDQTEDRELSDAERLEQFRANRYQSVLPDLPRIPGHHTMWLTTTNARDSIQNRLRMGYQLLLVSDCPGWDGVGLKIGPVDNVVGVNEMVAAKIPTHLYNLYMREAHHNAPLEEESKLADAAKTLAEQARGKGARVEGFDGMDALNERVDPPRAFAN